MKIYPYHVTGVYICQYKGRVAFGLSHADAIKEWFLKYDLVKNRFGEKYSLINK